ncbi:MAG: hypothetical protein JNK65_07395 [Deltaproteobacteria bacterium]|nr:hypothetical protein [Deltaproteobacteria bacterium]
MKKIKFVSLSLLCATLFLNTPLLHAGAVDPSEIEIKTTRDLKKYMYKFGSMIAGIELLRSQEPKPDWKVIDLTLKDMTQTLNAMKKADKKSIYKGFTDQLEAQLEELNQLTAKKDSKIYDSFDKLTNTCFQCHAAHRPADFLKPDRTKPYSENAK